MNTQKTASVTDMEQMTSAERRIAMTLAGIFSLRMLGLFMILPVFAIYARDLQGYTATLAGLAIGIYGLTQAVLQIPLGWLSDRIGRKPVIIGGLLVFALGSVVAALSTTLEGVILGRALQGAGAIASAIMALAADLTREEHRMKVMATIGMSIGLAFAAALVLGPLLQGWFGVPGIFWTTALLALLGIGVVLWRVPRPVSIRFHRDTEVEAGWFRHVLSDTQLLRLDVGVLILHMILTATFMAFPHVLEDLGLPVQHHWWIYLPVLVVSVALIIPFILLAEKKRRLKQVLNGAVLVLGLAAWGLQVGSHSLMGVVVALVLFFAAFNLLEALLPSLVAKLAPAAHKGTAMGAFSTGQFLGAFLGGTLGGWMSHHYGVSGVFLFNAGLAAIWLILTLSMRQPPYLRSQLLHVGDMNTAAAQQLAQRLSQVRGVVEAIVIPEDGIAYLKVDSRVLDRDALLTYSAP